jgi:hypothetical protein
VEALTLPSTALRLFPWYREDLIKTPFYDNEVIASVVSLAAFIALCIYLWMDATKKRVTAE